MKFTKDNIKDSLMRGALKFNAATIEKVCELYDVPTPKRVYLTMIDSDSAASMVTGMVYAESYEHIPDAMLKGGLQIAKASQFATFDAMLQAFDSHQAFINALVAVLDTYGKAIAINRGLPLNIIKGVLGDLAYGGKRTAERGKGKRPYTVSSWYSLDGKFCVELDYRSNDIITLKRVRPGSRETLDVMTKTEDYQAAVYDAKQKWGNS
jgi:hypothetical protein